MKIKYFRKYLRYFLQKERPGYKMDFKFDKYEPPKLTAKILEEEQLRRNNKKVYILLGIATMFLYLFMTLFAFFICSFSYVAAVICICVLCFSLAASGIIFIVFLRIKRRKYYG